MEGTFLPQLKLSFFLHSAVGSIVPEAAHAGAAVPFTGFTTACIYSTSLFLLFLAVAFPLSV